MKRIILVLVAVAMLAGCGGGGETSVTGMAQPEAVTKTSVVDGVWLRGIVQPDGITLWTSQINFYNGTVRKDYSLLGANYTETGTFSISGDSITLHYTKSTSSPSGLSLSDLGTVQSTTTVINTVLTYKFTVAPPKMTFIDASGVVLEYTKPS